MKRIVVIGGGTGSFTVLRGLKNHDVDLTAVVSMFDSGGSTGRLRDEFGYLPAGDVRRCILALAPDSEEKAVLRKLLDYRFPRGEGLARHNFGNLLLTALTDITGSDLRAIESLSGLLNIAGRVLPVTLDNRTLCARLEDGSVLKGEANIDTYSGNSRIRKIYLNSPARVLPAVVETIKSADVVVLGPGDLFTSVLPNVLVKGVKKALKETNGKKVYVCNVMTKRAETHGFVASDFLREVQKYAGSVDYMIVNTAPIPEDALERYAKECKFPVLVDRENISVCLVEADVLNETEVLRHDSNKLAEVIMRL